MFSFRTTPLDQQQDLVLRRGRVGVLCNHVAWNPSKGEYLFETLYKSGNLKRVFALRNGLFGELSEGETGDYGFFPYHDCEFVTLSDEQNLSFSDHVEQLEDLDCLIVEVQELGVRYDGVLATLFNLFETLHINGISLSVYILDRENPTGRLVEGNMLPPEYASSVGVEGIPNRHGLTIGEVSNLFYSEIGAKFPLHIISYFVRSATKYMMPWSIPPYENVAGLFSAAFLGGQYLWTASNVSFGEGTSRPYEQFGAPFMESLVDYCSTHHLENWNDPSSPLYDEATFVRWTIFTPVKGLYVGQRCFGFQLLPNPGVQYHSMAHTLKMMRFVRENCPEFSLLEGEEFRFGDKIFEEYVLERVEWDEVREFIKVEEQKWIRKAKRFLLYDDQPWRVKNI